MSESPFFRTNVVSGLCTTTTKKQNETKQTNDKTGNDMSIWFVVKDRKKKEFVVHVKSLLG